MPNPDAANVVTPPPIPDPNAPPTPPAGAAGMGGPQQPAPQQAPVQPQIDPQIAHTFKTGLAYNALQGPDTQNMSPTQRFFKGIINSAILGMGAPTRPGEGWANAGSGAAQARKGVQEQQAQAQAAQQQALNNQLAAKKEAREQAGFDTEQQVRKAQLAQANAETLRTNIMTQGDSFKLHQDIANADKDRISTFANAGVKPVYEDIPESQMQDIIKNAPGSSALDWRHTGVKTVLDANGNPSYEYTLSAYDPKASAPLSDATVKQWDEDGLFKYHPEYKEIAKPGKVLTVGQFTALDQQSQNLANQNLAKTKNTLEVDHLKAQINESNAAVRAHNATTANESLNATEKRQEIARKDEEDKAWDALSKVGNDPDKLTDAHERTVIARSVQPLMSETLTAIKAAAAENDTAEQAELWGKYNAYQKLASLSPAGSQQTESIPTGAQVAVNPTTGERIYSTDNGKTWVPISSKPASPLSTIRSDQTLVQLPGQKPFAIDTDQVKTMSASHPDLKVVGTGTAPVPEESTVGAGYGGTNGPATIR